MFGGEVTFFSFRISKADYNSLKRIGKKQKMVLAEVGRRACSEYIRQHQIDYAHRHLTTNDHH